MSRFPVGNVFSHSAEKFRGGTLCFPEIFLYGQKIKIKRGVSRFPVDIFLSNISKHFVRELFCVSENVRYGKSNE